MILLAEMVMAWEPVRVAVEERRAVGWRVRGGLEVEVEDVDGGGGI